MIWQWQFPKLNWKLFFSHSIKHFLSLYGEWHKNPCSQHQLSDTWKEKSQLHCITEGEKNNTGVEILLMMTLSTISTRKKCWNSAGLSLSSAACTLYSVKTNTNTCLSLEKHVICGASLLFNFSYVETAGSALPQTNAIIFWFNSTEVQLWHYATWYDQWKTSSSQNIHYIISKKKEKHFTLDLNKGLKLLSKLNIIVYFLAGY